MTSAGPPKGIGRILPARARVLLPALLVALVLASIHRLVCAPVPVRSAQFGGPTMGTSWSVTIARDDLSIEQRGELQNAFEAELAGVDERMSTYRPDSELSLFNAAEADVAFPVSADTLEVFRIAREISERSDGAFDVTVDPLVAAWGFGATDRIPSAPPEAELASLRERVGFRFVEIDVAGSTLRKTRAGVRCDLSAIAKGYAVDRVATVLEDGGFRDFLVEVGGEVRARGRRLDGAAWRVAIERPESDRRVIFEIVGLREEALATSGDYRNFYEVGGRRVSHTIDPRTGRPVEHLLASVSVLHREAARADAWATALTVLGPEKGFARAESEGLGAFFIVRSADGRYDVRATPAFDRALARAQAASPDSRTTGANPHPNGR